MDRLGVQRPDHTPHATEYVEQMVALIDELIGRGHAYETSDGVYFEVKTLPGYGLLARQPLELAARRRAGRDRRGQAGVVRLRALEEGQAGRADVGVTVGRRAGRAGTSSAP